MTQVKQGCHTSTSPGFSHQQKVTPCFPARAFHFPALIPLAKMPTGRTSQHLRASTAQPTPTECKAKHAGGSSRTLPGSGNCGESSHCLLSLGSHPALPTPQCPRNSSHLCASLVKKEKSPSLKSGSGRPHHSRSGILHLPLAAFLTACRDTRGHQQTPASAHPSETKG